MTRQNLLDLIGSLLLMATAAGLIYALAVAAQEHVIEQEAQPQ